MPLMLEGQVDERDQLIETMQEEIDQLRGDLAVAKREAITAATQSGRAVSNLRRQLTPLYQALQAVFGEMEAIGGADAQSPQGSNHKWDAVKSRLAPRLKEAVDIFLLQGTMKRTQLASAMRMDYSNCAKNVIAPLLRQGLLIDHSGNLSLKEL